MNETLLVRRSVRHNLLGMARLPGSATRNFALECGDNKTFGCPLHGLRYGGRPVLDLCYAVDAHAIDVHTRRYCASSRSGMAELAETARKISGHLVPLTWPVGPEETRIARTSMIRLRAAERCYARGFTSGASGLSRVSWAQSSAMPAYGFRLQ
jgi:hypothetical protein